MVGSRHSRQLADTTSLDARLAATHAYFDRVFDKDDDITVLIRESKSNGKSQQLVD